MQIFQPSKSNILLYSHKLKNTNLCQKCTQRKIQYKMRVKQRRIKNQSNYRISAFVRISFLVKTSKTFACCIFLLSNITRHGIFIKHE